MDTEYLSSPFHVREFLEHVTWIDIKAEIMDMLENVKDNLISAKDHDELMRFQGRAEVLRDIILLPEVILEALEESKEKDIDDSDDNYSTLDNMEV